MERRSYRNRAEYLKQAVIKRRRKLKEMLVAYKGGKCEVCGYAKCVWALDLHHRDPNTKTFGISEAGVTRAWKRLRREADKCMLVCANCHREIEAGVVSIPTKT